MMALTVTSQLTISTLTVRRLELLDVRQYGPDYLLGSMADPDFYSSKDCSKVAIALGQPLHGPAAEEAAAEVREEERRPGPRPARPSSRLGLAWPNQSACRTH